jgi:dolichyl-phosphate beta-glucosyltransferase
VASERGATRLTVVIPAYREVHHIGATVDRIRAELGSLDGGLEILIVDDGSGDGTADAAAAAGADRVIALPNNRGKGAALRAGMLAAHGRTVAFTDADLSYAPGQIVGMVELVESGWDVVAGNRLDPASTTVVEAGALRRIGGRAIHLATRLVVIGEHPDTQCGLKAFDRDAARRLFGHSRIGGFAFDVEIIHLVERYGLSMIEVPVEVRNSDRSTVHVARDALRLLVDLLRIRWNGRRGRYDLVVAEAE